MDRNQSYYNYLNECMQYNKHHKKENMTIKKVKKSRSKEDLHLLSISEIVYDNKLKIPENDYIKIMNHLKDLSGFSIKSKNV